MSRLLSFYNCLYIKTIKEAVYLKAQPQSPGCIGAFDACIRQEKRHLWNKDDYPQINNPVEN